MISLKDSQNKKRVNYVIYMYMYDGANGLNASFLTVLDLPEILFCF